jgi:hypothetical protein
MPGDQGVLNYVLNKRALLDGLRVETRSVMRWPGRELQTLNAKSLATKTAEPVIVHWAGLKKARLSQLNGFELLSFFEKLYYSRLPAGSFRRALASYVYMLSFWLREIRLKMRLRTALVIGAIRNRNFRSALVKYD